MVTASGAALRRVCKYEQIMDALRDEIRSGALGPGQRLPGENELAATFGVSRNTVRQALAGLKHERMIESTRGAGSFVTEQAWARSRSFVAFDGHGAMVTQERSWSRPHYRHGVAPSLCEVLRCEVVEDHALASALALSTPTFVALDRLRLSADKRRIGLESNRVPMRKEIADIPVERLGRAPLEDVLADAGIMPWGGEEWVETEQLDGHNAHVLERLDGETFLRLTSVNRDVWGAVIRHTVSRLDPAHFGVVRRVGGDGRPA